MFSNGDFANVERGDGSGGCSIYGLLDAHRSGLNDVTLSQKRYIKSTGRLLTSTELREKGIVVASEMQIRDTIGSQFLITLDSGPGRALDGLGKITESEAEGSVSTFLSLGKIVEDENDVLSKINEAYCDRDGRPYADIRIVRMYILDDPFDDPDGLEELMENNGVRLLKEDGLEEDDKVCARWLSSSSPSYDRPPGERIDVRVRADQIDLKDEGETTADRINRLRQKEARSQAVILEMVGDLPSADIKPPENVLFVCKLNPVTEDEDLELIFSRFDPNARAEIIRDQDTGQSLQYAFIEFSTPEQSNEAYLKMNNTLIDDRRIKVDFSQSVAKIWNKYAQRRRDTFDRRPNAQGSSNGGLQHPDGRRSTQTAPLLPQRQYNRRERDHREDQDDYGTHYRESYEDGYTEGKDHRNRNDDRKRSSHHHKHHKRDRGSKRSRSRERHMGSSSSSSDDNSHHRRHKSHRKNKKKHKSRS